MKDQSKIKPELIQELVSLRQRIAELEQSKSERKRVQEALQESEKRYREVFEGITDVFYRTDNEGFLLIVSPKITSCFQTKHAGLRAWIGTDNILRRAPVGLLTACLHINPTYRAN